MCDALTLLLSSPTLFLVAFVSVVINWNYPLKKVCVCLCLVSWFQFLQIEILPRHSLQAVFFCAAHLQGETRGHANLFSDR